MKPKLFLLTLIVTLLLFGQTAALRPAQAQSARPVIVLSPGHGWLNDAGTGVAPGAVYDGLQEKDVNLAVAQAAERYLSRCPVDVRLTRSGDDAEHSLYDVDEMVNAMQPTVGVSIHANSDDGMPSGTEAMYTVGGWDDAASQRLARLLADSVAAEAGIANRGLLPETSAQEGGLYIHHWHAPAALIETGFLQGDHALLRDQPEVFGRAIARALLTYLDMPLACAARVETVGLPAAVMLPGESKSLALAVRNDGLTTWAAGDCRIERTGGAAAAQDVLPLLADTPTGAQAEWTLAVTAPAAGIHHQTWQLTCGGAPTGSPVTVRLIVLPEEAGELKAELERKLEEARQAGQQELERILEEIEAQVLAWIQDEAEQQLNQCLQGQAVLFVLLAGLVLGPRAVQKRIGGG